MRFSSQIFCFFCFPSFPAILNCDFCSSSGGLPFAYPFSLWSFLRLSWNGRLIKRATKVTNRTMTNEYFLLILDRTWIGDYWKLLLGVPIHFDQKYNNDDSWDQGVSNRPVQWIELFRYLKSLNKIMKDGLGSLWLIMRLSLLYPAQGASVDHLISGTIWVWTFFEITFTMLTTY